MRASRRIGVNGQSGSIQLGLTLHCRSFNRRQVTCNLDSPTNMLGYILMAVIGGMMGALFNSIVEHLNHIRAHHIHKSAVKRMLEVVVLALLTGTAVIYLPMSAPCSIAGRSIVMRDSAGCLSDDDYAQISHGWLSEKYLRSLFNVSQLDTCMQAGNLTKSDVFGKAEHIFSHMDSLREKNNLSIDPDNDWVSIDNIMEQGKYIHLHYEHFYTCDPKSHTYNDMAMLWLNGGVKGVKVLMQRGFPHMVSKQTPHHFLCCLLYSGRTNGRHECSRGPCGANAFDRRFYGPPVWPVCCGK